MLFSSRLSQELKFRSTITSDYQNPILIVLVIFLFSIKIQAHQQLYMIPNVTEQVIQASSNLKLTCIFYFERVDLKNKDNVKIEWMVPYNLPKDSERLKTTLIEGDTQTTSTMTLEHVRPEETGYFGCKAVNNKSTIYQDIQQYVYIFYEKKVVINAANEKFYYDIVEHGEFVVHIPYKPTHPNVTVYLLRPNQDNIIYFHKSMSSEDYLNDTKAKLMKHDLLTSVPADSNRWTFNPRQGLTLKSPKIDDAGSYIFYVVFNNNFQLLDNDDFILWFQGYQRPQIIVNSMRNDNLINAGSNLTLTCVYAFQFDYGKDDLKIVWDYPKRLTEMVIEGKKYTQTWKDRNETHLTSTMTLINVRPENTGNFSCHVKSDDQLAYFKTLPSVEYIYVYETTRLIIMYKSLPRYQNKYTFVFDSKEETIHIPCKVTHPNVTVSLSYVKQSNGKEYQPNWKINRQNLLSDPNSNWQFQPQSGLTLKNPADHDSGQYVWTGTLNNFTDERNFVLLIKGDNKDVSLRMLPEETETVVESGSDMSLTCIYADQQNNQVTNYLDLQWKIPQNVNKTPSGKGLGKGQRVSESFHRNETHMVSTLTLINSRPEDTGSFSCGVYISEIEINGKILWTETPISQYVYVYNATVLMIVDEQQITNQRKDHLFVFNSVDSLIKLPCKPTHPNVTISLTHVNAFNGNGYLGSNQRRFFVDVLSDSNSNWEFHRQSGLTLKNPNDHDSGRYECVGTLNNVTDKRNFVLFFKVDNFGIDSVTAIQNSYKKVVEAGSNFTATCLYEYPTNANGREFNIWWAYPSYLVDYRPSKNILGTKYQANFHHMIYRNDKYLLSTLTITDAQPQYTGNFGCETDFENFSQNQYIYVHSSDVLIFIDDQYFKLGVHNDHLLYEFNGSLQDLKVPCKPTHPNVTIELVRKSYFTKNGSYFEGSEELLLPGSSGSKSSWMLESVLPERGLTLNNPRIYDSGVYKCVGSMDNRTSEAFFTLIISGMELERIDDGDGPAQEGSNVTLSCGTLDSIFISPPPEWHFLNEDMGRMEIIDETNPPNGIKINSQKTTLNFTNRPNKKANYYQSRLDLMNITLNTTRVFQCIKQMRWTYDTGTTKMESKNISIQIKEKFHDLAEELVRLENGSSHNLSCSALFNDDIQWLKDGKEYSGLVYSSDDFSVLPLQGIQEEIGTYACRWKNSLGQTRFKNFTVVMSTVEIQTNISIIVGFSVTTAILLAIAIGITFKMSSDKKNFQKKFEEESQKLLEGTKKEVDPNIPIWDQTESLTYDEEWEFPRERLELGKTLGEGNFGKVVKGEAKGISSGKHLYSDDTVKTVAVKMIKPQSDNNITALEALVSELKICIYIGPHPNVVNLLGACTKQKSNGEFLIIFEYCPFGSLKNYLTDHRRKFLNLVDRAGEMQPNVTYTDLTLDSCLSTRHLISWSLQIARGMEYLASKNVLHGDLAARNVLLADDRVAKIADFGLSRKMRANNIYRKKGKEPLPVKWLAVESLDYLIFTSQSDVWSYGILLWEMFSLGQVPYLEIELSSLIEKIKNGYRMKKPEKAPNLFWEIMVNCWNANPSERPTFSQLVDRITDFMTAPPCSNLNVEYATVCQERETTTPIYHQELSQLSDTDEHSQIVAATAQINHVQKDSNAFSECEISENVRLLYIECRKEDNSEAEDIQEDSL